MNNPYQWARDVYQAEGVDTEAALAALAGLSLSLHCWQGDDVGGFETPDAVLSGGGIQVTGNHPGKARSPNELRMDLEKVYALLPGSHRLNLHAIYGEFGGKKVDRDEVTPDYFTGWMDWAKDQGIQLDFNGTYFSHPKADEGMTLSHPDPGIRDFWIEHSRCVREIAHAFGKSQGSPSVHNLWVPDGSKDRTVDRFAARERLRKSLDKIFETEYPADRLKDAVESKLFGIGSESFTVGSHEFYLGYVLTRKPMLCLDTGHFHPSESVADKISAVFQFQDEILLHISRPVRWDSDHVVILDDPLLDLAQELVRAGGLNKTWLGLDFFDASLNRIGAWVTGARSSLKAFLIALLEPTNRLAEFEAQRDFYGRMALDEHLKGLPWGIVWDEHCRRSGVPIESKVADAVSAYHRDVLSKR